MTNEQHTAKPLPFRRWLGSYLRRPRALANLAGAALAGFIGSLVIAGLRGRDPLSAPQLVTSTLVVVTVLLAFPYLTYRKTGAGEPGDVGTPGPLNQADYSTGLGDAGWDAS